MTLSTGSKNTTSHNDHKSENKMTVQAHLFPLPRLLLNPGGKLTLNIFEPRYLNLLKACENDGIYMAIGNASDRFDEDHDLEIPHEKFPYLYPEVGFGKVQVLAATDAGTKVIVVSGQGKGRIKEVHQEAGGFLSVELEEVPTVSELEGQMEFMYRRLCMITRERVFELLGNEREVNVLMDNLQNPPELIAFYSDHLLKDSNVKMAVFKANDINEKLHLIGQSLLH
jgi:Lon protease-like protein